MNEVQGDIDNNDKVVVNPTSEQRKRKFGPRMRSISMSTAHNIAPIADGIGRPEYSGRPDFQTGRDSTAPKMAGRAGQWSTMQKAS